MGKSKPYENNLFNEKNNIVQENILLESAYGNKCINVSGDNLHN